jgi:4-hydroxy-3-polyprenylbenzoate decarboxylase
MSPGKHGGVIMAKYHDRGQPCPVAVVVGMHPALFMLAGLEVPYGKSELEAAGGILGEPVEVFNMPRTGLPVPANSEIAFEGFIEPKDKLEEGPLGECIGRTPFFLVPFPPYHPTTTLFTSARIVAARFGTSSKQQVYRK